MPRFAANLSMMYHEHDFLDRFSAAAADGFEAVEYLFPYEWEGAEISSRLDDLGLTQVLFNAPPGDWGAGERGLAALPGREAEFRSGFDTALDYAVTLGCAQVHVMAGLAAPDANTVATYEANLVWAAARAGERGRDVLIEPINHRDMPGYLLSQQDVAHDVVQRVGASNLKVQMDLYHCQSPRGTSAPSWTPTSRRAASATSRSPGCRPGTSPTWARCAIPISSSGSTRWATAAGSVVSTGRRPAPRRGSAGCVR